VNTPTSIARRAPVSFHEQLHELRLLRRDLHSCIAQACRGRRAASPARVLGRGVVEQVLMQNVVDIDRASGHDGGLPYQ
jgi:hypothetical protein